MASVKVVMSPGWEEKVQDMEGMRNALTTIAWTLAARATANSAGFRTEKTINYATGEHVGGKSPLYLAKDAVFRKNHSVALVYTGNYAAAKDNTLHNTLLKSK